MQTYKTSFLIFTIGTIIILFSPFINIISLGSLWVILDANSLVGFQGFIDEFIDKNPSDPSIYFNTFLPMLKKDISLFIGFMITVLSIIIRLLNK